MSAAPPSTAAASKRAGNSASQRAAPADRLSVSMHFVNMCVELIKAQPDGDAEEILRVSGISPRLLEADSRARVTVEQFSRVYLNTMRACGDETLRGLDRPTLPGSFAFGCRSIIHCSTVGEALSQMAEFYNLLDTGIRFQLCTEDELTRMNWTRTPNRPPLRPEIYESMLVAVHRLANWLIARHIPLQQVTLPYPAPAHADEYRNLFFGHPVQFDGECASLSFPAVFAAEPLRQDERTLNDFLRRAPLTFLHQNYEKAGYGSRVRTMIRTHVQQFPSFEEVAERLELHPRTLWRRLKKEGVTYRDIKNQLRRDIAIYHLGQKRLSVESIAFECGFSESSTFIRAFREWTGVTPNDYRKRI